MPNKPADCDTPATRRRGRPVQMDAAEREALVLDCAIALLSEHGPVNVTMSDIASHAGMSKRTLYSLYGSREELLGAGLKRMSERLFRPLEPEERGASLEERLRILLTLTPAADNPEVPLEMLRVVIAKARQHPEMGRNLSQKGPGHVVELLSNELAQAAANGEITLAETEVPSAAELLVDMVLGNTIACLLDPNRVLRLPEERAARRDQAIHIFLNGLRPRDISG